LGITSGSANGKHFAMIVDNEGHVVWSRRFPNPVVDFQKQPNGHYTVLTSIDGSAPHFYEMDRFGTILHEYYSIATPETDVHELRLTNGGYYLFGVEYRDMDLSPIGGNRKAHVRGLTVEYIRETMAPFIWNTFDHLSVTDAAPDIDLNAVNVNPWHGNAIDMDTDGNLLVSFRNADEVLKLDVRSGAVLWRLGGRNSSFTFVNDPLNGFSHQHGVRRIANGDILMFDNGNLHQPPVSRPAEYRLDKVALTATLVWEFRHDPPLFGGALGFAQRLQNGNTLICYGLAQRVIEVDMSGQVHWDLQINEPQHFVYRAFRIDAQ